jgi:hypothetical protein
LYLSALKGHARFGEDPLEALHRPPQPLPQLPLLLAAERREDEVLRLELEAPERELEEGLRGEIVEADAVAAAAQHGRDRGDPRLDARAALEDAAELAVDDESARRLQQSSRVDVEPRGDVQHQLPAALQRVEGVEEEVGDDVVEVVLEASLEGSAVAPQRLRDDDPRAGSESALDPLGEDLAQLAALQSLGGLLRAAESEDGEALRRHEDRLSAARRKG